MRTLLLTLCLLIEASVLPAQSGPQPSDQGVPAILRDYFGLTAPQILQIVRINADLESLTGVKNQEIAGLQVRFDTELQEPVLDAATVGALAIAMEQARRDVRAAQAQALTSVFNVLSADQRRRLQALQAVLDLQPVIDAGISYNFLQGGGTPPPTVPAGAFRKLPERLPLIPRGK